jgi:hypothetical protein
LGWLSDKNVPQSREVPQVLEDADQIAIAKRSATTLDPYGDSDDHCVSLNAVPGT